MKTIYRKRVRDSRYELTDGVCYRGVHFGRRSFYILKGSSRFCGLNSLRDVNGAVSIN
jgi:hypothetical protein